MSKQPATTRTRSQPGIENCRVLDIGLEEYAECVQQGPCLCSYALPFGYCFLCNHPRLAEILENTRNAKLAAKH